MLSSIESNNDVLLPNGVDSLEAKMDIYSNLMDLVHNWEPIQVGIVPPIFVLLQSRTTSEEDTKKVFDLFNWMCSIKEEKDEYIVSILVSNFVLLKSNLINYIFAERS